MGILKLASSAYSKVEPFHVTLGGMLIADLRRRVAKKNGAGGFGCAGNSDSDYQATYSKFTFKSN